MKHPHDERRTPIPPAVIVDQVELDNSTSIVVYSDGSFYLATGDDYHDVDGEDIGRTSHAYVKCPPVVARKLVRALLAALPPES